MQKKKNNSIILGTFFSELYPINQISLQKKNVTLIKKIFDSNFPWKMSSKYYFSELMQIIEYLL